MGQENLINRDDEEIDDYEPEFKYKLTKEIIRCNNLVKEYELGEYIIRALDGVSLDVLRGDFIAIQGPSGAGKTTLLQLIAGLDTPTSGEIKIEWVKSSDLNEEMMTLFRVLNIGFIFQNYNLISSLTAEENILFPMQLAGVEIELQNKRVNELLEKVKLSERREHLPFQLSSGEQQRIGIARALANDPPIILADEPTANLDKKSIEIIAELFKELNQEGKTIIVVTHDQKFLNSAYRIITIDDGKIIQDEQIKTPETTDFETKKGAQIPDKIREAVQNQDQINSYQSTKEK